MDSFLTYFNTGLLLPCGFLIMAFAAGTEQNLWRRVIKIMLCALLLFVFYGMVSALWSQNTAFVFFATWLQPLMAAGVTGISLWAYLDHRRFH